MDNSQSAHLIIIITISIIILLIKHFHSQSKQNGGLLVLVTRNSVKNSKINFFVVAAQMLTPFGIFSVWQNFVYRCSLLFSACIVFDIIMLTAIAISAEFKQKLNWSCSWSGLLFHFFGKDCTQNTSEKENDGAKSNKSITHCFEYVHCLHCYLKMHLLQITFLKILSHLLSKQYSNVLEASREVFLEILLHIYVSLENCQSGSVFSDYYFLKQKFPILVHFESIYVHWTKIAM